MTAELKYTDAVLQLMAMDRELVPASAIAPIVGTHPSQIIDEAKKGQWDRSVCNYIVIEGKSGKKRVKFFRVDFLRKGGWIQ